INFSEAFDGTDVVVDLTGTGAAAGDTLTIHWGFTGTVDHTLQPADITGNSATVTVPGFVIASQGQGTIPVSAKLTDVAGNVGLGSAPIAVNVDTLAPLPPSPPALSPDDDTGTDHFDHIT